VIKKAIPAFEAQFPGCKALFAFDNARNRLKFPDDTLSLSEINLEPGGKNAKKIRDTFVSQIVTKQGRFHMTNSY